MIDREKTIKGLEACIAAGVSEDENPCASCPYFFDEFCQSAIKNDALTLLREQEPLKPFYSEADDSWICRYCCETVGYGEFNPGGIDPVRNKYCPECGREVKWDD